MWETYRTCIVAATSSANCVLSRHCSPWAQRTACDRHIPRFLPCCFHLSFSHVVCKTHFISVGIFFFVPFFLEKYKHKAHSVLLHSVSSSVTSADCCINTGALTGRIHCAAQAARAPVALYWFCPFCTEDCTIEGNKLCFMKLRFQKLIALSSSEMLWKPSVEWVDRQLK